MCGQWLKMKIMVGTLAVKNEIPVKNEINSLTETPIVKNENSFAGVTLLKMKIILWESLDNC